jgi:hypothetical protein
MGLGKCPRCQGDGWEADRMEEERRLFQSRLSSAEAKEAITAFFEKRAPDFSRLG